MIVIHPPGKEPFQLGATLEVMMQLRSLARIVGDNTYPELFGIWQADDEEIDREYAQTVADQATDVLETHGDELAEGGVRDLRTILTAMGYSDGDGEVAE